MFTLKALTPRSIEYRREIGTIAKTDGKREGRSDKGVILLQRAITSLGRAKMAVFSPERAKATPKLNMTPFQPRSEARDFNEVEFVKNERTPRKESETSPTSIPLRLLLEDIVALIPGDNVFLVCTALESSVPLSGCSLLSMVLNGNRHSANVKSHDRRRIQMLECRATLMTNTWPLNESLSKDSMRFYCGETRMYAEPCLHFHLMGIGVDTICIVTLREVIAL